MYLFKLERFQDTFMKVSAKKMCLIHDTKCCTKNNYCPFKDWHGKLYKLDNEDLFFGALRLGMWEII